MLCRVGAQTVKNIEEPIRTYAMERSAVRAQPSGMSQEALRGYADTGERVHRLERLASGSGHLGLQESAVGRTSKRSLQSAG